MKCYNCKPSKRAIYRVESPWWMSACNVCKPLFEGSPMVSGKEVAWHRVTIPERIKHTLAGRLIWLAYKVNPGGC